MSKRKSTTRAKIKAIRQEERRQKRKEHFKNRLGNSPKVTHKPIIKNFNSQLDIKQGLFTEKEFYLVLTEIKSRKAAGLEEEWKARKFDDLQLRFCNAVYNPNTMEKWTKGCILTFPKKDDLAITKNYKGITLTSIAAKVRNALLLNRIKPEIEKILTKNQNSFWRNRSTTS